VIFGQVWLQNLWTNCVHICHNWSRLWHDPKSQSWWILESGVVQGYGQSCCHVCFCFSNAATAPQLWLHLRNNNKCDLPVKALRDVFSCWVYSFAAFCLGSTFPHFTSKTIRKWLGIVILSHSCVTLELIYFVKYTTFCREHRTNLS